MRDIDGDQIVGGIITLIILAIIGLVLVAATADHRVRSYYLGSSEGAPAIKAEINWADDQTIRLDRTMSYEDAVKLVNSLNEGLKK